jgi:hypothetical protein
VARHSAALIDSHLSPADLAGKVEYLGAVGLTGGLIMDQHRTLCGGDPERAPLWR